MWFSGGRNTWAFRWKGTHIIPFGTTVSGEPMAPPFYDRYFVGGEWDLRGFYLRSVSPWAMITSPVLDLGGNPLIDPTYGLPLVQNQLIVVGGDTYTVGTVEYRVPIIGPLQMNLFADIGSSFILREQDLVVFGPDTYIDLVENTNNVLRMSTGAEVQFLLPMLNQPFRLIFAYNPIRMDTDVLVDGVSYQLREPSTDFKFTVGYSF
jgi:outer membrane protein insertion porin family